MNAPGAAQISFQQNRLLMSNRQGSKFFDFRQKLLEFVDIHLVQMKALTRHRIERNALGVWS